MQPTPHHSLLHPPDWTRLLLIVAAALVATIACLVGVIAYRAGHPASSSSPATTSAPSTPSTTGGSEEQMARQQCQTATIDRLIEPASPQFRAVTIRNSVMGNGSIWQIHGEVSDHDSYRSGSGYSVFNCVAIHNLTNGTWRASSTIAPH